MAVSRRTLLRHGVLAAAAYAGSPLAAFGGSRPIGRGNDEADGSRQRPTPGANSDNWQDHTASLNHLSRTAFSGAIGTDFKVFLPGNASAVFVTLLAVRDLPPIVQVNPASFAVSLKVSGIAPSSSGFVLAFGGSSPLPQGTYLFEHSDLGRLALLTVPAGNGQQVYTAVINRLDVGTVIPVSVPVAKPGSAGAGAETGGGISFRPGTSSTNEIPSRGLSGSPGIRRGAVRD